MKSEQGFTLIEILVVVAMVGILTSIAAPSWTSFVDNQRMKANQDTLLRAIKSAQSQAKTKSVPVTLTVTQTYLDLKGDRTMFENAKLSKPIGTTQVTFSAQGLPTKLNSTNFTTVDFEIASSISKVRRCVSIATLLGTITTKDKECG